MIFGAYLTTQSGGKLDVYAERTSWPVFHGPVLNRPSRERRARLRWATNDADANPARPARLLNDDDGTLAIV